jgi:hypothetical protein
MVEVVDHREEDIVEKVDTEDVLDELLDTEDAPDQVVVDIVEAREDLQVEATVVGHPLSEGRLPVDIRVDQVADHLAAIAVARVAVEDIRVVALLLEVADIVETLLADHLVVGVAIVDLHEEVQVAATRKIDHLARVSEDIATIAIVMVDHLVVKHNKKRRKPLF